VLPFQVLNEFVHVGILGSGRLCIDPFAVLASVIVDVQRASNLDRCQHDADIPEISYS